ncbi:hypothetical protein KEM60_03344 [Austwickia sp. TVS 96-490-7B]|uniref:RHS repeat-associated core domain-containing protein n=1 Tax=Austwickia sp. TVS 96-490-7B TaxID=2830843 RepID=UPI001C55FD2D|nr:RHS repeat-associated core domain-containing protein [Austwickia sp. TVS 96-490-7B]MBW3087114.1 hypothetical protein [Austwickia sp. TVS 96-490-7B]
MTSRSTLHCSRAKGLASPPSPPTSPQVNPPDEKGSCPLGSPGQLYDEDTGWIYNLHRYYDPHITRYTTPDPLGPAGGTNPHNPVPNPTTWTDPWGLTPQEYKKAVSPGSINYGALDSLGRPTGVSAFLTPAMVDTGSRAARNLPTLEGKLLVTLADICSVNNLVDQEEILATLSR